MKLFELNRGNHEIVLVMTKISHIEPHFPNKNNWNATVLQQKIRNGYVVIMDNGKEIVITDEEFKQITAALADC